MLCSIGWMAFVGGSVCKIVLYNGQEGLAVFLHVEAGFVDKFTKKIVVEAETRVCIVLFASGFLDNSATKTPVLPGG